MTDAPPRPPAISAEPPAGPRTILITIVIIVLMVLFIFGRLSPCNTLRDNIRVEIAHNGGIAASLLPLMQETALTRLTPLSSQGLSAAQCLKLDLTGENVLGLVPAQAKLPSATLMAQAGATIAAAIQDCRDKRMNDMLKTHVESVQCSNPLINAAYTAAGYPYMDIVTMFTAKRLDLASQLDKDNLTDSDEQDQLEDTMVRMVDAERARLEKQP